MREWLSYGLGDFLLFSPRVYDRLFLTHNEAWWPLPLAWLALAPLLIAAGRAGGRWAHMAAALALAAAWAYVAITFLAGRYAPINPVAAYAAWGFGAQAVLLGALGLRHLSGGPAEATRSDRSPRGILWLGVILMLYATLGHPLLALPADASWRAAQVFGMAPDPTAIMTLGWLVARASGWRRAIASIIPAAWCLLSALTLVALDRPVQGAGLALGVLIAALPRSAR